MSGPMMPGTMSKTAWRQRGVSLVTAIFLLVALSALAVAMVTLSTTQQTSSALDTQGTRAYLAARAGAEWGVFQVTRNGACPTATFALPPGTTLSFLSVTVICTRVVDAVTSQPRYTVRSTACNLPGIGGCPNPRNDLDFVQRVVHVEFSAPGVP